MKNGYVALLAVALLLGSAWAVAQEPVTSQRTRPPSDLKRVEHPEPHYSPYEPPSPEEMQEDVRIHVVQQGDTLWDLATAILGDPYYWPQIWEANRYITDPRWIYPGDPLVVPRPMVIAEVPPPPVEEPDIDLSKLPSPEPAAKKVDVYCATYIIPKGEIPADKGGRALEPTIEEAQQLAAMGPPKSQGDWIDQSAVDPSGSGGSFSPTGDWTWSGSHRDWFFGAPRIIGNEHGVERVSALLGDVVYINRGEADGVVAGDEFFVVREEQRVNHPLTGEFVGMAMAMAGHLKVLCTQRDTATVEVIEQCGPVWMGDLIKPYEPIPIPLVSEINSSPEHCNPAESKLHGTIIHSRGDRLAMAEENVINLDVGSEHGLAPGDFLVIYRPHPGGAFLPARVIGDAVVLIADRTTSIAKIVFARNAIHRGDAVALR